MLATSCLPRRLTALRCLRTRSMSSVPSHPKNQTPQRVQTHTSLPPAKMRALIALYHQSEDWITEENLMERIDQAFVHDLPSGNLTATGAKTHRSIPYEDIKNARDAIMTAPKMSSWNSTAGSTALTETARMANDRETWSSNRAIRERKVVEALYGVVTSGQKLLPGLEIVQEAAEIVQKHRKLDREREREENSIFEREEEHTGGEEHRL